MAVDLQRLGHMLLTTGAGGGHHEHASAAAMPARGPCYGAAVPSQRGHHPYANLFTLPLPTTTSSSAAEQYWEFLAMAAADLAKKGVSPDGAQEMITTKRRRDERSSALGTADVLIAHAQQQTIDVDHILLKHARKMWTTMAEHRQSHMGLIVSTVEARASKRLKDKDEEIERIRSMNWALGERLRNLFMEARMWCNLTQSNEATANVLRGDLQRVLDAHAVYGSGSGDGQDDADIGRCKGCREGTVVLLLLPCRHLCVCTMRGRGAGVPGVRKRQERQRLRQLFVMREE